MLIDNTVFSSGPRVFMAKNDNDYFSFLTKGSFPFHFPPLAKIV